jgi:hypothetical protein
VPESPKTKTDPIQAQLDELKREREQDRLERITDSLSIELAKRGVDAKRAAREAKLLKMEHGDKLTLDDSRQVIFRHSDTQETPLSTWLDAWLQSDEGRFILPSKATPRSPGIVPGRPVSSNAQTVQLSGSVLRGVNPADIVSGKIVVAS